MEINLFPCIMKCPCCHKIYGHLDPLPEENEWVVCIFCKGLFQWNFSDNEERKQISTSTSVHFVDTDVGSENFLNIEHDYWQDEWEESRSATENFLVLVNEDLMEGSEGSPLEKDSEIVIKVENAVVKNESEVSEILITEIEDQKVNENEIIETEMESSRSSSMEKDEFDNKKIGHVKENSLHFKKNNNYWWGFIILNGLVWFVVLGSILYLWERPNDVLFLCQKMSIKNEACNELKNQRVKDLLVLEKVNLLEENGVYHGVLKLTNMNNEQVSLPTLIVELRKNSKTIVIRKKIKLSDFFGLSKMNAGEVLEKEFFFGDLEEQVNEYTFELENV